MKKTLITVMTILTAALGTHPAAAASPAFESRTTRLTEIAVHRYVGSTGGGMIERRYLLDVRGGLTHVEDVSVPVAVTIPAEAYDKVLLMGAAWSAYRQLGPKAFANFELTTELPIMIADRMQFEVRVSANARYDLGRLINVSTRGTVTAVDRLVAGFVVTEQSRRVLVRAVGPGLTQFGVAGTMTDPYLTIYRGRTPIYFNGDWTTRPDAIDIARAAASTGAFALPAGSKDSAIVVELEPGEYTVQVEPESGAGGIALVEVYSLP